jgi:hypothetical protein
MNKQARNRAVKQFTDRCDKLEQSYEFRQAQTGTVYITVLGELYRFADHADAYGTANYTCDGVEGTYKGAVAHLLKAIKESNDEEIDIEKIEQAIVADRAKNGPCDINALRRKLGTAV